MENTMYEILKDYSLPLTTKARIKRAKTDRDIAMILFDGGYANYVGELFKLKDSKKFFIEWVTAVKEKIDIKLGEAAGTPQKFDTALKYQEKMLKRVEENKILLADGRVARRHKRAQKKAE